MAKVLKSILQMLYPSSSNWFWPPPPFSVCQDPRSFHIVKFNSYFCPHSTSEQPALNQITALPLPEILFSLFLQLFCVFLLSHFYSPLLPRLFSPDLKMLGFFKAWPAAFSLLTPSPQWSLPAVMAFKTFMPTRYKFTSPGWTCLLELNTFLTSPLEFFTDIFNSNVRSRTWYFLQKQTLPPHPPNCPSLLLHHLPHLSKWEHHSPSCQSWKLPSLTFHTQPLINIWSSSPLTPKAAATVVFRATEVPSLLPSAASARAVPSPFFSCPTWPTSSVLGRSLNVASGIVLPGDLPGCKLSLSLPGNFSSLPICFLYSTWNYFLYMFIWFCPLNSGTKRAGLGLPLSPFTSAPKTGLWNAWGLFQRQNQGQQR